MKYFYEKPDEWISAGSVYFCDHPMYNRCTLFQDGKRGVAIVQEHFDKKKKTRWWGTVEPWIAGELFFQEKFPQFFSVHATEADERGLFPTFRLRQVMWELRMKPLQKEYWEEF